MTCTLELPFGEKIDENDFFKIRDNYGILKEDVSIDGGTITIRSDEAELEFSVKATKFNFIAIIWWLLIVAFALAIITSIWMIISLIIGKDKEKQNISASTDSNTADEKSNITEAEKEPTVLTKKTCSNCGKEIDDDVVFLYRLWTKGRRKRRRA